MIRRIAQVLCLLVVALLPVSCDEKKEECKISKNHKVFSDGCEKFYKFSLLVSGSTIRNRMPDINAGAEASIKFQAERLDAVMLSKSDIKASFVPHGLWLNLIDRKNHIAVYPSSCVEAPIDITKFPGELNQKMKKYYVDVTYELYKHEWQKHGTCFKNPSPEKYFGKVFDLLEENKGYSNFLKENAGKTMSFKEIQDSLIRDSKSMELICSRDKVSNVQFLEQVWLNLDENFKPLPLTDITRLKSRKKAMLKICDENDAIHIMKIATYSNVSEIMKSLPKEPVSVGLNIDRTILNSDLLLARASKLFNERNDEFWSFVNKSDAEYSSVRSTAKLILAEHKKRGDKIYFITSRKRTDGETLSKFLADILGVTAEDINLAFTNGADKREWISKYNNYIFYGNSDEDMVSAMNSDITYDSRTKTVPVRMLRLPNSTSHSIYRPGRYGETIVINSIL